jgi:hypothetical protein
VPDPETARRRRSKAAAPRAKTPFLLVEIKKVAQEGSAAFAAVFAFVIFPVPIVSALTPFFALTTGFPRHPFGSALDKMIELAAVQPHPSALRAVVNLDPLPLGHQQINIFTRGAIHFVTSFLISTTAKDRGFAYL